MADGEAEGDGETFTVFLAISGNISSVSPSNATVVIDDLDDGR